MDVEKYILIDVKPMNGCCDNPEIKLDTKSRIKEAWAYTYDLFKKIYLYIIIGIVVGALIHGYVPTDFIAKYAGGDA